MRRFWLQWRLAYPRLARLTVALKARGGWLRLAAGVAWLNVSALRWRISVAASGGLQPRRPQSPQRITGLLPGGSCLMSTGGSYGVSGRDHRPLAYWPVCLRTLFVPSYHHSCNAAEVLFYWLLPFHHYFQSTNAAIDKCG